MIRTLIVLIGALAAFGADDGWKKVQELKSGVDVRVFKKGASEALLAQFYEADGDKITIIIKKEQVAIRKTDVTRIEARSRLIKRETTKEAKQTYDPNKGPSSSWGTSYSLDKPPFDLVYTRKP